MRIFVSQRMYGVSVEGILEAREKVKKFFNGRCEIINNVGHENLPENAGRLEHLGESIKLMQKADLVIFIEDWFNANGCKIEMEICKLYGIDAAVMVYDPEGIPYLVKVA